MAKYCFRGGLIGELPDCEIEERCTTPAHLCRSWLRECSEIDVNRTAGVHGSCANSYELRADRCSHLDQVTKARFSETRGQQLRLSGNSSQQWAHANSRLYSSKDTSNDNATRTAICNKDHSYICAETVTVATRTQTVALIATVMRT